MMVPEAVEASVKSTPGQPLGPKAQLKLEEQVGGLMQPMVTVSQKVLAQLSLVVMTRQVT